MLLYLCGGMQILNSYIEAHRRYWISALIDVSRRNPLLFLNPENSDRFMFLGESHTEIPSLFLRGEILKSHQLNVSGRTNTSDKIIRRAIENYEERGIQTLYLCMGTVAWPSSDAGRDYLAPLLLLPLQYADSGIRNARTLQWTGDIEMNRSLQVVWKKDFNILIPDMDFWLHPEAGEDSEIPNVEEICTRIIPAYMQELARGISACTISPQVYLGNFSYQKMALVQELESAPESLYTHTLLQALCGDMSALQSLRKQESLALQPEDIDTISPEDDYTFLPADSSQFLIIRNIISGLSGVMQGPPGTGKSQTIANVIAEMVARGKKVLFVAEKRAALDVVYNRLKQAGLQDFVLDLQGFESGRKQLRQQLIQSLALLESPAPLTEAGLQLWAVCRKKFLRHTELFHRPIPPWNITGRELLEKLAFLPKISLPSVSLASHLFTPFAGNNFTLLQQKFISCMQVFQNPDTAWNWKNYSVATSESAQKLLDYFEVLDTLIPIFIQKIQTLQVYTKPECNLSIDEFQHHFKLFHRHNEVMCKYSAEIHIETIEYLHSQFSLRPNPGFKRWWDSLFNSEYKKSLSVFRQLHRGDSPLSVHSVYIQFYELYTHYQNWNSDIPFPAGEINDTILSELNVDLISMNEILNFIQKLSGNDLSGMKIQELYTEIQSGILHADDLFLHQQYVQISQELISSGFSKILHVLEKERPDTTTARTWIYAIYLKSIYTAWRKQHPDFVSFNYEEQFYLQQEFKRLDLQTSQLAIHRIKRQHAEQLKHTLNAWPEQEIWVRRQAVRKRVKPLKQLYAAAPEVMRALFPVWMGSPLSLCQMMEKPERVFDLVIFDEASQIRPEDAISAIIRGSQILVAGDSRQLPPTPFFAAGPSEAESDQHLAASGFESLLDMASVIRPSADWMLTWHYRSRHESLIRFANQEMYQRKLITFPSPQLKSRVSCIQIHPSRADSRSYSSEMEACIDQIIQAVRDAPNLSLGVITLGIQHALELESALKQYLNLHPDLYAYFDTSVPEPFFIKNLERVQGDERDIIILSTGYGQNGNGSLSLNFGPLSQTGGERRLNVAITRARHKMITITSFGPQDIDLNRAKGEGMRVLKAWLEYSLLQTQNVFPECTPVRSSPVSFEQDVQAELEKAGYTVVSGVGASQYTIDLAVYHPDRADECMLGIECDGLMYQMAPCVRDRVRLRPAHLESLGWTLYRIWSADWYHRKKSEVQRLLGFCQERLKDIPPAEKYPAEPFIEVQEIIRTRKPKPPLPAYDSIHKYTHVQLSILLDWIKSDGLLRTEARLMEEMRQELGFKKSGSRIEERLRALISGRS